MLLMNPRMTCQVPPEETRLFCSKCGPLGHGFLQLTLSWGRLYLKVLLVVGNGSRLI